MRHQWIRITQAPVDVIVDPVTGEPFVFSRDEPVGEAVGCDNCGCPLTREYVSQPCVPVDAPAPTP